jgi:hypothetical protein
MNLQDNDRLAILAFKKGLPYSIRSRIDERVLLAILEEKDFPYSLNSTCQDAISIAASTSSIHNSNERFSNYCKNCNKVGHTIANCRRLKSNNNNIDDSSRFSTSSTSISEKPTEKCSRCNRLGHIVPNVKNLAINWKNVLSRKRVPIVERKDIQKIFVELLPPL